MIETNNFVSHDVTNVPSASVHTTEGVYLEVTEYDTSDNSFHLDGDASGWYWAADCFELADFFSRLGNELAARERE